MTWQAPTRNLAQVTGYEIQYSTNSTSWTSVSPILAANATSASVTGLTPGSSYYFRISAIGGGAQSAWTVFADTLTDYVSVVSGGNHTCAITSEGAVECWGANDQGQLGDGTLINRTLPVRVAGLSSVSAITAGAAHTCALLSDGSVRCWGDNVSGQLGNGTTTDSRTPVAVTGLGQAVEISAGGQTTCARLNSGEVQCWGLNSSGQLGNGTLINSSTPTAVVEILDAVELSVGAAFACAVLSTGGAACWGAGGSGQRNIVIGRCQNGSYNGNDYGSINSAVTVTISSPTGKIKRVVIAYGCVSSADVNRYYTGSDPGFQNIVISNFTARTAPVLNIATPVCNTNSTSVNLSATASSTSSPTYAWTTTGGTINSGSNGLTPNVKGPGTFTLIAYNGVSTCSTSANITLTNVSCNLLPVELTEFNAGRVNEYVVLNWQTASEINNDYFAIERSLDGTNFQTIDIVKGKGNTHQRVNYQATDNEPGSDITYYRLKQVDLNGKYTYSKIVAVEASEKEIYISQPIPNPFNDEFSISFQLKNKIEFITEIYDLTGKKVRTDYDIFEPGTSHKFFHLKDYENGIYFLNIKSIDGSSSFNYKLIKN
jgi:hypothetical protein